MRERKKKLRRHELTTRENHPQVKKRKPSAGKEVEVELGRKTRQTERLTFRQAGRKTGG